MKKHGGYYKNARGAIARWDNGSGLFYLSHPIKAITYEHFEPQEKDNDAGINFIMFTEIVATQEYLSYKKC